MDPLCAIPKSQWPALHDLFQINWPCGVEGYCLLDILISNPHVVTSFNFTVYCPGGVIRNGMIAVSDIETYHLYICPIDNDNLNCIEESLLATEAVNWDRDIIIPSVMPEVLKVIDRIGQRKRMDVKCTGFVIKYLYSLDSLPFCNLCAPSGTYIGPLKCEYLSIIDATWPFHSDTSLQYFRRLMENNQTYVLYSEKSNQPLAWVAVDESGALCHLYSLEKCRRKGYGAYITKVAINDLLRNGQHVLTYSVMDNFPTQKLFVKLGFQNLGLTSWVFLSRRVAKVPSCSYCRVMDFYPLINQPTMGSNSKKNESSEAEHIPK